MITIQINRFVKYYMGNLFAPKYDEIMWKWVDECSGKFFHFSNRAF